MTQWRTMTRAEWNAWHTRFKTTNRFPKRGRNAASGKLADVGTGMTSEVASYDQVDVSDVRVLLPELDDMPGRRSRAVVRDAEGRVDVVRSKTEQVEVDAEPFTP